VVKVLDTAGAPMPNVKVVFRVLSGGGKIINGLTCNNSECAVTTAADGSAAIQWQTGRADSQKVEARIIDQPDLVVQFTAFIDTTGVQDQHEVVPTQLTLRQHPNPFREFTRFEIALPAAGYVSLKIYDLHGREVNTLTRDEKPAGKFFLLWNGRDQARRELAAGIYFAVLRFEVTRQVFTEKRQVLYLK